MEELILMLLEHLKSVKSTDDIIFGKQLINEIDEKYKEHYLKVS